MDTRTKREAVKKYPLSVSPEPSRLHLDPDISWVVPLDPVVMLGLTGPMAAGKTTLANYLSEWYAFERITLSVLLRAEARRRGMPAGRWALKDLGDKLRHENGADYLARLALEEMKGRRDRLVVIDGIRNPAELRRFVRHKRFFAISVTAPANDRWKRLKNTPKSIDVPSTKKEFMHWDLRDRGFHSDKFGQRIDDCIALTMKLASHGRGIRIKNSDASSPKKMYDAIDRFLQGIGL